MQIRPYMSRLDESQIVPFPERPSRGRGGCRRERNLRIAPLRRGDWGCGVRWRHQKPGRTQFAPTRNP